MGWLQLSNHISQAIWLALWLLPFLQTDLESVSSDSSFCVSLTLLYSTSRHLLRYGLCGIKSLFLLAPGIFLFRLFLPLPDNLTKTIRIDSPFYLHPVHPVYRPLLSIFEMGYVYDAASAPFELSLLYSWTDV